MQITVKHKRVLSRIAITAVAMISMTACDTLLDPSVSVGMDVGPGGSVPYGNINFSTVFPPYQYNNPYYWGPGYNPSPVRPWRPPQSVTNPPPQQPGGSFPGAGQAPVRPGGGQPELRPNPSIPSIPATPNQPTGNGQRPGGNTPVQTGGSTSVRPGGH